MRVWLALLWLAGSAGAQPLLSPSPSPVTAAAAQVAAAPVVAAPVVETFASRNRAPVYRLDPIVDTALLLGGLTIWVAPFALVGNTTAGPSCDPCDRSKLNVLDRPFAGRSNLMARQAADGWVALPVLFLIGDVADVGGHHWRSYLSDFTVLAETLAWDGALQEIVRRAVRRPRPYLYAPGLYPADRTTAEATFSFYSGHTSSVFSMATGFSYTFMLRHPHSKWIWAVWTSTLALATVEPFLRVTSGDHFPTDVLVGAIMGTAFGLLIPALHRIRVPAHLSLVPSSGDGKATLSIAGRF